MVILGRGRLRDLLGSHTFDYEKAERIIIFQEACATETARF